MVVTLLLLDDWRHNGAMVSIQIKDVPEDTHRVLRQRAGAAHQSLQEYLRSRLIDEASRPTVAEVLSRAAARTDSALPLQEVVKILADERDRR